MYVFGKCPVPISAGTPTIMSYDNFRGLPQSFAMNSGKHDGRFLAYHYQSPFPVIWRHNEQSDNLRNPYKSHRTHIHDEAMTPLQQLHSTCHVLTRPAVWAILHSGQRLRLYEVTRNRQCKYRKIDFLCQLVSPVIIVVIMTKMMMMVTMTVIIIIYRHYPQYSLISVLVLSVTPSRLTWDV
jgi:hypothetical protein